MLRIQKITVAILSVASIAAAAPLLESDPRKLANYPTDRPWTSQERATAAAAVHKWWAANREKYVQK